MTGDPIEGQVLLLTAAKASVPGTRLPELVDLAQSHLEPRLDDYRRRYECVTSFDLESADAGGSDPGSTDAGADDPDSANAGGANPGSTDAGGADGRTRRVEAFLVESDHWADLGADLGFEDRETDAVRRAHVEQLRRLGRREDRSDELEAALEIRSSVLIAEPVDG